MAYKDPIGNEIKSIFEEETEDMKLSSETFDNILESRKLSLRDKIGNFLNKEIEVPLTPAIIGFVLLLGISIFPKGFQTTQEIEIIDLNGSQIIMKVDKEVSGK